MSVSTLEILPDEILMLILKYSGNTINVLQTFLGLNQRFNSILLDQQLHLLTDYLSLKPLAVYYNSTEFQQVINQLSSIRVNIDEEELHEILLSLYAYSIRQRYLESKEHFQLLRAKYESVRQVFSRDELQQADEQLKNEFFLLQNNPVTLEAVQRIKELILNRGACLQCDNYELTTYNLATAINDWILCHITKTDTQSNVLMQWYSQIIQLFLISNPDLLDNRGYVGNGGCIVDFFLLYALLRLQSYYGNASSTYINLECFQITLKLCFLTIHCRSANDQTRYTLQIEMLYALSGISMQSNDLQIQISQFEIIKLTFEHVNIQLFSPYDIESKIPSCIKQLVKMRRFDILKYVSRQELFQDAFNTPITIRECINSSTGNRADRQAFSSLLKDPSTAHLFSQQHILFILLSNKEHKFLEILLRTSPDLINQLDDQGNDPLLYVTLNVFGCRHRIIEMLIKKGCNQERKNANGQTFRDALQLQRNEKLLKLLFQHAIIN